MQDRFGNLIDESVGYARGSILRSSFEEALKYSHGQEIVRRRAATYGAESIAIFSGNLRQFPIEPNDLGSRSEEWVGPALFWPDLAILILEHLGGRPADEVAVFNRTSAGLIAAISAIGAGGTVVSYAHAASGPHVSVGRGAQVGGSSFLDVRDADLVVKALSRDDVRLLVITSVSSELDTLDTSEIERVARLARERSVPVLLDDAYGARLRPVTGGPKSLELGVDFAISNSDKAGMEGPRAGFMAGRPELVRRARARAAELGQEARAPIALGVLRSLQRYTPSVLKAEMGVGQRLARALAESLGSARVRSTLIGPLITEADVMSLALERAPANARPAVVPCEATAGLGMLLLEREGILTVNALGQPGSRVSLRLKPTEPELDKAGGESNVVSAVDRCLDGLGYVIADERAMRRLILGSE